MSNEHIHPLFAAILAAHAAIPGSAPPQAAASPGSAPPQAPVDELRLLAYRQMLKRMDWSFEFSDDYAVYRRGREQLAQLKQEQQSIDPAFTVWNELAPAQCKNGVSYF